MQKKLLVLVWIRSNKKRIFFYHCATREDICIEFTISALDKRNGKGNNYYLGPRYLYENKVRFEFDQYSQITIYEATN